MKVHVMNNPTADLLDILRDTLEAVEREPNLDPNDPVVLDFTFSIRHSIAELEAQAKLAA
ncbi:MAG TPA: hypothetical protein VG714_00615 [Acidobacteriaceae bacterium]|nr:hypothetical protein [Acidobacteriaceae bacterium]